MVFLLLHAVVTAPGGAALAVSAAVLAVAAVIVVAAASGAVFTGRAAAAEVTHWPSGRSEPQCPRAAHVHT
eukprot:12146983-Alexandrium_andersonii.AAC.1